MNLLRGVSWRFGQLNSSLRQRFQLQAGHDVRQFDFRIHAFWFKCPRVVLALNFRFSLPAFQAIFGFAARNRDSNSK